mmetsp:Transcript_58103/g.123392  ORF Transcript_58103/g.123392 Transcript_58103/m.123392 type:complete len:249 (-) Transcript_58103:54-800(-)|eukprot:CAMPEP_0206429870 /NCGR_PEP_ID=MMETSP0324_2-20121206/6485_1 /ASSEMBLY_ACC=CAM_ASM_000836 /TAXON_ID=2866 /ORGANISM="Crypthecodinium cohnii, Strain Seligo" /LENGTH=248 /DNA_ID=CAMNT_0053895607 /DNA_START=38 /DNA_END=784 /DNA_ORIENTATION=-
MPVAASLFAQWPGRETWLDGHEDLSTLQPEAFAPARCGKRAVVVGLPLTSQCIIFLPEAKTRQSAASRQLASSAFLGIDATCQVPTRSSRAPLTSFLQSADASGNQDDDDDDEREATIKAVKDGSGVPRYEDLPVCCNGMGAEGYGKACEKTCKRDPRYSKWPDGVAPLIEPRPTGMPPPKGRFSLKKLAPIKVPKSAPWVTYWSARENIGGSYDGWAAEIIPPAGTVHMPRHTLKDRSRQDLEADSA